MTEGIIVEQNCYSSKEDNVGASRAARRLWLPLRLQAFGAARGVSTLPDLAKRLEKALLTLAHMDQGFIQATSRCMALLATVVDALHIVIFTCLMLAQLLHSVSSPSHVLNSRSCILATVA